eukprot:403364433
MKVVRKECRGVYQQIEQKDLVEIEIMNQISNPYLNKLIDYYFQVNKDSKQEELVLLQPLAMCDLQQFLQSKNPYVQCCLLENYPDGGMPEKSTSSGYLILDALGFFKQTKKKLGLELAKKAICLQNKTVVPDTMQMLMFTHQA